MKCAAVTVVVIFCSLLIFKVKGTQVFSSCSNIQREQWIKGFGAPIKSWTQSLTPFDDSENLTHYVKGTLDKKGYFKSVKADDIQWKKFGDYEYDGWLYSSQGNTVAYIYDDFRTVIIGNFQNSRLKSGYASKIIGYRCHDGIMELRFSSKSSPEVYSYDPISEDLPGNPTLMDPLEKRQLYLAPSTLSNMSFGDGLFARKTIQANSLVAIYAGQLLLSEKETLFPNMTDEVKEDVHKNWLYYDDTYLIDVPPSLTDFVKYRASLGHKANNAFGDDRNTEFCYLTHPRFGNIRGMRSLRTIQKGEEIFEDYQYDMTNENTPEWYRIQYNEFYGIDDEQGNDSADSA